MKGYFIDPVQRIGARQSAIYVRSVESLSQNIGNPASPVRPANLSARAIAGGLPRVAWRRL